MKDPRLDILTDSGIFFNKEGNFYFCDCKKCKRYIKSFHRNSIIRTLKNGYCLKCKNGLMADNRLVFSSGKYEATCISCNTTSTFTRKPNAIKMLDRKSCKHCENAYEKDARVKISEAGIVKKDGKWWAVCSKCERNVAYTSAASAKKLVLGEGSCKKCYSLNSFNTFNKKGVLLYQSYFSFERGAKGRKIKWDLTYEYVCSLWNEVCSLSGLKLEDGVGSKRTWSLDRINNDKGYEVGNVQIIHKKINMMKGKLTQDYFLFLCKNITFNTLDNDRI